MRIAIRPGGPRPVPVAETGSMRRRIEVAADPRLLEALRLYVRERRSLPEVSRETGMSPATLSRRLCEIGVVLRTRQEGLNAYWERRRR